MIFIFSKPNEPLVTKVCNWLDYFNEEYILIDSYDKIIDSNNFNFLFNYSNQKAQNNNVAWFWKNLLFFENINSNYKLINNKDYNFFMQNETHKIIELIYNSFNKDRIIGLPFINGNLNKFEVLSICKNIGFNTPISIITNDKIELIHFIKKYKKIITKPLSDGIVINLEKKTGHLYTKEINYRELIKIPDFFFPSYFQEKIDKKYELRVIFINNQIFTSAILTKKKSSDLKIEMKSEYRIIPYKLPLKLKKLIFELTNKLNLNFCSIDFIKSTNNKYYILEVNQTGQIDLISNICNYSIEKIIAKCLIKLK